MGRRHTWTPEQDERLRRLVPLMEGRSWRDIAERFGEGRSGKQCYDRWKDFLRNDIDSFRPWTVEEDAVLDREFKIHGARWTLIAKSLPGRSGQMVKNRYSTQRHETAISISVVKRRRVSTDEFPDVDVILALVDEIGDVIE